MEKCRIFNIYFDLDYSYHIIDKIVVFLIIIIFLFLLSSFLYYWFVISCFFSFTKYFSPYYQTLIIELMEISLKILSKKFFLLIKRKKEEEPPCPVRLRKVLLVPQ